MSCDCYNEISSHQIENLVFSKELFAPKLNIDIVKFGIDFKTVRYIIDKIKAVQQILTECTFL